MWLVIHLIYLVGFKNRITALLHWTVSFIGQDRSERTITAQQVYARTALQSFPDDPSGIWGLRRPGE
jgi:NADH dehydrogenase